MAKMKSKKVRVRFAPAPTGVLHVGGARTALFNYLFVKKEQGVFILRLEDTDRERSKPEYEKDIIASLEWLGIKWNEQYKQSERTDIYKKYLKKLVAENKAYFCFCTTDELEAQKQEQLSRGQAPRYSGQCAQLSKKEQQKLIEKGSGYVIRFRTPAKEVVFSDIVRSKVKFDAGLIGDIVIAKDFEQPLYNFAAVVDDFEMQVSHIIRGEDHISNTPKQILLQETLGFPQPAYCHLPLILGRDRSKLSKRHGTVAVDEYRKQGYLPEALVNFMALLGWNPGTTKEIFSTEQLIKEFSLEKVQKAGAVFNLERLDYLNGFYIRHKSINKLTELCLPYLIENDFITPLFEIKEKVPDLGYFVQELGLGKYLINETKEKIDFGYLKKIVAIYQERLKKLSEITTLADFFFEERLDYDKELLRWKQMTDEQIIVFLDKSIEVLSGIKDKDFSKENLEKILLEEAEKFSSKLNRAGDRGCLLWPLRAALSSKKASATPFEIAEILGKEKTLKRIREAKNIFINI